MRLRLGFRMLLLQWLLFLGSSPALPSEAPKALIVAIEAGNVAEARRLLAAGADANATDDQGHPLLMLAFASKEVTELLAAHGADVNARYRPGQAPFGNTPLHVAAGLGKREVVEVLIAHGADVNAKDARGVKPLFYVVAGSALSESSCAKKMNLQMLWALRETRTASAADRVETLKVLLEHGASLSVPETPPQPLFFAAMCSDRSMVEFLIDRGAELDELTAGETALHASIAENRKDIAELLVNKGANVNSRNVQSARTPLHFLASYIDDPDLAELMINHGAFVSPIDKQEKTPLDYAIGRGNMRVADVLRRHGAVNGLAIQADWDAARAANDKGDYATASRIWRKLAELGVTAAQLNLGLMYSKGDGVAQDYGEAMKWYLKAAAQRNAKAQNNVGNLYYLGQGVAQNYAEAARWYRRAAEQGNASAQRMLGTQYAEGKGVPRNAVEGVQWVSKAANQGDAKAQAMLGVWYAEAQGVPQNNVEAYKWFDLAISRIPASDATNRDNVLKARDSLASKMTHEQVEDAEKLAREWKPK